jgi:hypothetical protein
MFVAASLIWSSCGSEKYRFGGASSPDNAIAAVWYQDPKRGDDHWLEDCVQLIRENQRPAAGENCTFVGVSGDNLRLKWPTSRHLEVSYPPGTKVFKADAKWNDVTITYAEDPKLQKY